MCTRPALRYLCHVHFRLLARSSRPSSPVDDDFIVPDGSDEEPRGRSSSCASSRRSSSARSSGRSSYHEDEDEDEPKKKRSAPGRPAIKKALTENPSAGNATSLFLTAAEQRTQEKKTEKKSAEDPFGFLVDARDVSVLCRRFFLPNIVCRRMVYVQVNPSTIPALCTSPKKHGSNSLHLRNR